MNGTLHDDIILRYATYPLPLDQARDEEDNETFFNENLR